MNKVKTDYKVGDKVAARNPCLWSQGLPKSLEYGVIYTIESVTKIKLHTYGGYVSLKELNNIDNSFCPSWFIPVYKEETFRVLYGKI